MALTNHHNRSAIYILSLIDVDKAYKRVQYALRNNHKDFTFVLFDYLSSMEGEAISQEQMSPFNISIHSLLSEQGTMRDLTNLLCPNSNFVLYTRRKFHYVTDTRTVPTNYRQFVMKMYAHDAHDHLPSLISMNTTSPFV
jgi:hypothetical protein